ncbi:MAG: DUF5119 domain-containing protein [Bacteroidales bacterium]|nr:DUF5119 domain-containing protein [Bacteroidales bacterium]
MMSYYNNLQLMIKRTSIFILCTVLLSSCHFRDIISEDDTLDKLVLDLDVDWSDLDETPTGMTLALYPTDGTDDSHVYHYNTVDHVSLSVPNQDYSILCMNQSEDEFANFVFDLSSFENASVMVREDGTSTKSNVRYGNGTTRGVNLRGVMMPGTLAIGSLVSVKSEAQELTRGVNLRIVILPNNVVKGMSLEINAFGLTNGMKVQGTLTNLAAGVSMHDRKPLKRAMDQELGPEAWSINLPKDDKKPGSITCTFGTFGPVPSLQSTRGALDDGETLVDVQNILKMDITKADGEVFHWEGDVTSIVRQLTNEDFVQFTMGNPDSDAATNYSTEDDYIASDGTFVFKRPMDGFANVKVEDWSKINQINVDF